MQAAYGLAESYAEVMDIFLSEICCNIKSNELNNALPCDIKAIKILGAMQSAFESGQSIH